MAAIMKDGQRAFDFIDGLNALTTVEAVMQHASKAFTDLGFGNFVVSGLPNPRQRFKQVCLAHRWPLGWFELYEERNFVHYDPVASHCRATMDPFLWSEAPLTVDDEPMALQVMNLAGDFGMKQGFCLPIHGVESLEACISLSTSETDLDPKIRPMLHLMGMYTFGKLRVLLDIERPRARVRLTPREREVLSWTAVGKSAWETGQILSITKRTVDMHVMAAATKLGARNKTQAVALAVQDRLISV